jgi:hypothetical protein
MLRAAAWSVGLFGFGMVVCRLFPEAWLEAPVLLALGITMLVVSARSPRPRRARLPAPKEAAA